MLDVKARPENISFTSWMAYRTTVLIRFCRNYCLICGLNRVVPFVLHGLSRFPFESKMGAAMASE